MRAPHVLHRAFASVLLGRLAKSQTYVLGDLAGLTSSSLVARKRVLGLICARPSPNGGCYRLTGVATRSPSNGRLVKLGCQISSIGLEGKPPMQPGACTTASELEWKCCYCVALNLFPTLINGVNAEAHARNHPAVLPHFTLAPALRTTTHLPARFSRRSIHTDSPLWSFPSRILFSVTPAWATATSPNTCTSIGPFSYDTSLSLPDLKSSRTFSLVMTLPELPMVTQSSA